MWGPLNCLHEIAQFHRAGMAGEFRSKINSDSFIFAYFLIADFGYLHKDYIVTGSFSCFIFTPLQV